MRIHSRLPLLLAGLVVAVSVTPVSAGPLSKAIRETTEYVLKTFTREAAEETAETLTRKLTVVAAKHGDEGLVAVRKVGPRSIRLITEAGEQGPQVVKLLARHGDEAVWIVEKPGRLAIFVKYGDDGAKALLKHRSVGEILITTLDASAVKVLNAVSARNGRRLAMLADDGLLTRSGQAANLLSVVAKYGDRAVDFIWAHRDRVLVPAVAIVFVQQADVYLDGKKQLPIPVRPGRSNTRMNPIRYSCYRSVCSLWLFSNRPAQPAASMQRLFVGQIEQWLPRRRGMRTVATHCCPFNDSARSPVTPDCNKWSDG